MGFLSKVASVGLAPVTGGASLLGLGGGGGVKNLLFGKKQSPYDPYKFDNDPDLMKTVEQGRAAQRSGLAELMKTATPESVRANMAKETRMATAGAEDAKRALDARMAQRGLGRSSVGMGVANTLGQNLAQRKQDIASSFTDRMRQRQQEIIGAGSRLVNQQDARTMITGKNKGRSGGIMGLLAPVAGGLIGAKLGGAKGAGQGMQMGSGISQALSNF